MRSLAKPEKKSQNKNRFYTLQTRQTAHDILQASVLIIPHSCLIFSRCAGVQVSFAIWFHGILFEPLQLNPLFMGKEKLLWLPFWRQVFILLQLKTIISSLHHLQKQRKKLNSILFSLMRRLHETQLSVKEEARREKQKKRNEVEAKKVCIFRE